MAHWILQHITLTIVTGAITICLFIFFLRDRIYRLKIEVTEKRRYFYVGSVAYNGKSSEYSSETPYWCLIARNTGAKKVMIESIGFLYRRKPYIHSVHESKTQIEPGAKTEVPLKPEIIDSVLTNAGNKSVLTVTPIAISQTRKIFKGKRFLLRGFDQDTDNPPNPASSTNVLIPATLDHPGQDREGRIIPQKRSANQRFLGR